jgi:Ca2+-binding RTX toxin-like protein
MAMHNGTTGNDILHGSSGSNTIIANSTDSIVATFRGSSASYSNDLYLMLNGKGKPGDDGDASNDLFLFNDHSATVGTTVDLGSFAVGTKLEFRMHVNTTNRDFYSGSANNNPDQQVHTLVQPNWSATETLVSTEDLFGGPFNYNDLSYSLTNVRSNTINPTGHDRLKGLDGNDTIYGYLGSDTINGGNGTDSLLGGQGDDVIFGSAGDDLEKGEDGNDTLWGLSGKNTLDGGGGNDTLIAGRSQNVLTGSVGLDNFRFLSNSHSTITDFSVADDTIQLASKFFTQLGGAGALNTDNFVTGTTAIDNNDYIVYDASTGVLSYDADANGVAGAVKIALLANHAALTAADFVVI